MTATELRQKIEEILPFVEKPSRYIGGEWNSVRKETGDGLRIALSYPDAYEVGISNVGLKILSHQINQRDDMICESVYAPWPDMEKVLRENRIPLFSLESHTPLRDFDIVGFSFQYELLYSNFLAMLELSGIPFYSRDRTSTNPIIIAGGPASVNPEPIAPFWTQSVWGKEKPELF